MAKVNQSESIDCITLALTKVQKAIENPHFNAEVSYSGRKFKYADLTACLDACLDVLSDNKIAVIQPFEVRDGLLLIHTRLVHESGQWIDSEYPAQIAGKHQDMGSAITYGRRYGLCSMLGITAEPDNDAQSANDLGPASVPVKEETQAPRKMSAKQIKDQGIWEIITERLTRFKTPADLEYLNEYKQELREEAKLWPQAFSLEVKELLDEKTRELQAQHQLAVGAV